MTIHIPTQTRRATWPDIIGATVNPTREQCESDGWREAGDPPPVADGCVRVSERYDDDGWHVVDRAIAEIEAEQYAQDLADNGPRYVLENQYIILCDVLRVALGGHATRAKIGFETLPGMMLTLKAGSKDSYEKLRDAMDMVNAALIRYDVRWWDNAEWHPQPELAEASNAIMGMV